MKKSFIGLMTVVAAICFSACSKTYYQVCTTKAVNPAQFASVKDGYVYEDQNVKITMDMWKENGTRTYVMENKTDRDIYLDWQKSCDYTNNNVYASNDKTNTSVQLLSPMLIVPAHKSREFDTYQICDSVFLVEGLKEIVRRSESMSFELNESPLVFGHYITYCFENHQGEKSIDLGFYVSRITNYSTKEFLEKKTIKKLFNGKYIKTPRYVQSVSPKNGYYVRYIR